MTLLQAQVEQLAKLLTDRISREIADGVEVKQSTSDIIEVEGVNIWQSDESGNCYVELQVNSKEIRGAFKPTPETLLRRKSELEKKLNEVNSKLQEYENNKY